MLHKKPNFKLVLEAETFQDEREKVCQITVYNLINYNFRWSKSILST